MAEKIHEQIGGTLVTLELLNPYPEDCKTIMEQVAKENEAGYLPPLKTKIITIEQYYKLGTGFYD